MLQEKLRAIEALPEALTGRPLVAELATTDGIHDGFGGAIYFTTEAYLRHPNLDPALRGAAERIRAAFIPGLAELQASYADEAAAAMERLVDVTALQADLRLFPVAGGQTLFDWVQSFLAEGQKLDALLSQRGGAASPEGRKQAATLRNGALGLIGRFRAAVADELRSNPALPRDLDGQLFGYFEVLVKMRAAKGGEEAPAPPPPPAPGTP